MIKIKDKEIFYLLRYYYEDIIIIVQICYHVILNLT